MTNPFTKHVWTAKTLSFVPARLGGTDGIIWNDDGPILDATLVRTIVTVHCYAYGLYSIGAGGIPNKAMGFGLGDINSLNFNGNFPIDDPEADFVDYIAMASSALNWTALGWPPDTSGHLSGSVNDIDSSATLATTENLNTYMYGTATLTVDSKAQRRFGVQPQFSMVLWGFQGAYLLDYDQWATAHVRFLWEQNA